MHLVLRADASPTVGTGHVMRQLALGAAWRAAGGTATLLSGALPAALERRVADAGIAHALVEAAAEHDDAARTAAYALGAGAAWVVLDGYHFSAPHQQALVDAGLRVLFVDDNGHAGAYPAHLVLNQNAHASAALYAQRANYTQLLLGPRWVLLRPEFVAAGRAPRPMAARVERLVVTLGGSDPHDVTAAVLRALGRAHVPGLTTEVVVGGANPRFEALAALGATLPGVHVVPPQDDLARTLAAADLAISAAGTTVYELAHLGVPALLLTIADNQVAAAAALAQAGVARVFDARAEPDGAEPAFGRGGSGLDEAALATALGSLVADAPARAAMAAAGRALVDGRGAERVVSAMLGWSGPVQAEGEAARHP